MNLEKKTKKQNTIYHPLIEIERVLYNSEAGRLTHLDVGDKSTNRKYFLKVIDSHI